MILNEKVEIEIDRSDDCYGWATVEAEVYLREDVTMVPYMEGNVPMRDYTLRSIRILDVFFVDQNGVRHEDFQLTENERLLALKCVEESI